MEFTFQKEWELPPPPPPPYTPLHLRLLFVWCKYELWHWNVCAHTHTWSTTNSGILSQPNTLLETKWGFTHLFRNQTLSRPKRVFITVWKQDICKEDVLFLMSSIQVHLESGYCMWVVAFLLTPFPLHCLPLLLSKNGCGIATSLSSENLKFADFIWPPKSLPHPPPLVKYFHLEWSFTWIGTETWQGRSRGLLPSPPFAETFHIRFRKLYKVETR